MDSLTTVRKLKEKGIEVYFEKENIYTLDSKGELLTTWHQSSVKSILTNEKYKGDALLQKQYTADFLTKKRKKNQGEIPQYYVEGNHEAIIPPETWELVQEEMERRRNMDARYSSASIFSSKIKCSECGNWYGSKVWHSQDKYRRVIFQCNRKFKNDKKCRTPHLTEDEIKDAFMKAVNAVIPEKDELIANTKVMMRTLCDTTELEVEQSRFLTETKMVAEMVKRIVAENKAEAMDQEEYQRRRNELAARYEAARDGYEKASGEISDRQGKRKTYMRFIGGLQKLDGFCTKFDEELWTALLDHATVYARDDIRFTFKAGNEMKVN